MNRKLILLIIVLALTAALRLPAPIVEDQPAPAPAAPEQPSKPKKAKTTTAESSTKPSSHAAATPAPAPVLQGPARFAGTWSGKISQGLLGHNQTSVTVDQTATSIELHANLGGGNRRLKTEGNTISWHSGMLGEITWTLTPNADGRTAQVTMKGMLVHDSTTFQRGSISTAASASSTPPEKSPAPSSPRPAASGNEGSVAIMGKSGPGSMTGPRPEYSAEAKKLHLSGRGTYVLHFDISTGSVTDVTVSQSTGSTVLDQVAINTFRQWHATPNGPKEVPMTITFGQPSQ